MKKSKKKTNKLVYSVLLLLVLVVCTLAYLLKDFKLSDILAVLSTARLRYVFLSMVMVGVFLLLEAFSLKIVMKSLKHKISWRHSVAYASVDFFFSGITPSATGGQPVQIYYMKKDRVPIHKSTVGILFNTIIYKIVLMTLGFLVLIVYPDIIADSGTVGIILFILGFLINIIAVAVCFMAIYWKSLISKIGHFILYKLAKYKIIKNIDKKITYFETKLDEYSMSAHYMKENKHIGIKLFATKFIQRLSLFFITYLVYRSFGYHTLSPYYLLAIQITVALCVDSMPFPGGVGLSEILLTNLFMVVYIEGEQLTSALLLTRGINFYFALLLTGAIVLINHVRLMIRDKNKVIIDDNEKPYEEEVL